MLNGRYPHYTVCARNKPGVRNYLAFVYHIAQRAVPEGEYDYDRDQIQRCKDDHYNADDPLGQAFNDRHIRQILRIFIMNIRTQDIKRCEYDNSHYKCSKRNKISSFAVRPECIQILTSKSVIRSYISKLL